VNEISKLSKFFGYIEDTLYNVASEGELQTEFDVEKFDENEREEIFDYLLNKKLKVLVENNKMKVYWDILHVS
jgi:hypothetical protein